MVDWQLMAMKLSLCHRMTVFTPSSAGCSGLHVAWQRLTSPALKCAETLMMVVMGGRQERTGRQRLKAHVWGAQVAKGAQHVPHVPQAAHGRRGLAAAAAAAAAAAPQPDGDVGRGQH